MKRGGPLHRRTPLRTTRRASTARRVDETWAPAREVALQRDGYRCGLCGAATREVHHRKPRGMGGTSRPDRHDPSVLLSVCRVHHDFLEGHREYALTFGLLVPSWGDAATTPVKLRDGWFVLSSDGTRVPVDLTTVA